MSSAIRYSLDRSSSIVETEEEKKKKKKKKKKLTNYRPLRIGNAGKGWAFPFDYIAPAKHPAEMAAIGATAPLKDLPNTGPAPVLLLRADWEGGFSAALGRPADAENALETNQPTNRSLITDHCPK